MSGCVPEAALGLRLCTEQESSGALPCKSNFTAAEELHILLPFLIHAFPGLNSFQEKCPCLPTFQVDLDLLPRATQRTRC